MKTEIPTRPTKRDRAIIRTVAKQLAPAVLEWCSDTDADPSEVTRDLEKALDSYTYDGYALARELDDYEPDARLVEILDGADHLFYTAHKDACSEWVTANGLTGPEVGSHVTWSKKPNAGIGEVIRNEPYGQAVVCFPDLGHVKEGTGYRGNYVDWEQLTPTPDREPREG